MLVVALLAQDPEFARRLREDKSAELLHPLALTAAWTTYLE